MNETTIATVPVEEEPEYVGAYSAVIAKKCMQWTDGEPCENDATHTVVMASGTRDLTELASCDECGEPEDAEVSKERKWSK
jgi:hypothetical protein